MNLPEIRAVVAQFLSTSDLPATSLVCKDWNASFTPVLYLQIRLPSHTKRSIKEGIVANAHHVQELYLRGKAVMLQVEYMYSDDQLRFSTLRKLCQRFDKTSFPIEHQLKI